MEKVLVVDNDQSVCWVLEKALTKEGYEVILANNGEEGLIKASEENVDAVIMDIRMPVMDGLTALSRLEELEESPSVIIMTGHGTVGTAIEAMKRGAFDYVVKPFDLEEIKLTLKRALQTRSLSKEVAKLREVVREEADKIVGNSPKMREVYKLIGKVAPTDSTVLLRGETGTGKELVARAIHHHSKRERGPFIVVNCASLPANLLESELFGHERGAYTGAYAQRIGKFERANNGTIFLDEIGTIDLDLQAKLLRVLQRAVFERIGGDKTVSVDVRVIAATSRDLETAIGKGEFREDLYYRLNVVPIYLPPLRERKEDISVLAQHFTDKLNRTYGRNFKLTPKILEKLYTKEWRGNVRELENTIERMVVLESDQDVTSQIPVPERKRLIPQTLSNNKTEEENSETNMERYIESYFSELLEKGQSNIYEEMLAQFEKPLIETALRKTGGNKLKAARILGINRNTLRKKIAMYGLEKWPF